MEIDNPLSYHPNIFPNKIRRKKGKICINMKIETRLMMKTRKKCAVVRKLLHIFSSLLMCYIVNINYFMET